MGTIVVVAPSGAEVDRIVLDGDDLSYDTGAASGIVDGLIGAGMTPSDAYAALADWSNGYLTSRELPSGTPPPPPIPGLVAMINAGRPIGIVSTGGTLAVRTAVASILLVAASFEAGRE